VNVPTNLPLQPLVGVIERITFYNEENGYTVARFVPEGKSYTVTVIGNMMGARVGESLSLQGIWTNHPAHGRQFEIKKFTIQLPATVEGIRKYLGSGLIKGVGPVTAKRIVDFFGVDTLDVIENNIDRLHEVGGVGAKRIEIIQKGWAEQKQIKEVMMFLSSHGVSSCGAPKGSKGSCSNSGCMWRKGRFYVTWAAPPHPANPLKIGRPFETIMPRMSGPSISCR